MALSVLTGSAAWLLHGGKHFGESLQRALQIRRDARPQRKNKSGRIIYFGCTAGFAWLRAAPAPARSAGRSAWASAGRECSHILGYMLMEVKPGMVLISLMIELAGGGFQQEIHARHSFALDRAITLHRQPLHFRGLFRRQIGGEYGLRPCRADTCLRNRRTLARAGSRRESRASGSSLPSTAHSNSRPMMPRSTIILRSNVRASSSAVFNSCAIVRLRNSDRRSQIGGLHEHRKPQRRA